MGFQLHEVKKPEDLPARIRIRAKRKGLYVYLTVKSALLRSIGAPEKNASFDILVGDGEDAGKLRLKYGKTSLFAGRRLAKSDMMTLQLGAVPGFPARDIPKTFCDAKKIDKDMIEITLPKWDEIPESDDGDADDDQPATNGGGKPHAAPVAASSSPAAPTKTAAARPLKVEKNGISLDLALDEEVISFGKKTMDLTTRQAAVVAALLRAMPSHVGREWLANNALSDMPAHARDASLDLIFRDLEKALPGVSLQLKITKGVGAALMVA